MIKSQKAGEGRTLSRYLLGSASFALMAAVSMTSVQAQEAAQPTNTAAGENTTEVVVVGVRRSQQSAIDRKKRAATPTDSIVAEDVGSFPDRNLNEAISRIAGTALSRNDFGEGDGVTIRGNGPDLTRVEIDGMGVPNTGGLNTGGDGRSADMRELPADLIKSVDVVKGTTADMTEGSLGGGIQIKTRTGLDFKKPYFSMRVGAQRNSLGKEVTPDLNIIASQKFFDNRLGIVFNLTSTKVQNNGHNMGTVASGTQGYARTIDFDKSLEKTFTFNPATVGGDLGNVALANSTETPLSLVTKSAAAKTKAECMAAFPITSTMSSNQKVAKINEQITCLNQWNDYHPSFVRNFLNSQTEERLAADIRFDYRVNDNLTLFGKYAIANRLIDDQNRSRTLGGVNTFTAGRYTDTLGTNMALPFDSINRVAIVPGSGYYIWNEDQTTGSILRDVNPGTAVSNVAFPTYGIPVNVDPASVKVDANHHVTEFDITDGTVNIDQIDNTIDTKTTYIQLGGNFKKERLNVDFFVARTEGTSTRTDTRTNRNYIYGRATMKVLPSGLWDYTLPADYREDDPSRFVQLLPQLAQTAAAADINNPARPAYTVAQRPLSTANFNILYTPRLQENHENSAKLDATYDLKRMVPFFTRFKTGAAWRESVVTGWGNGGFVVREANPGVASNIVANNPLYAYGGANYVAPIVVPTVAMRGTFRACLPTATSIEPCNYGYVPNTALLNNLYGMDTLTPAQMDAALRASVEQPDSVFFDGYPGAQGLTSWQGINVEALRPYLGQMANFNFDCLKVCKGSDGKMYEQPKVFTDETVTAAYYVAEFDQKLPWGMSFSGNFGVRYVETNVKSTGFLELRSVRKTSAYNAADPYNTAGVATTTIRQNANLDKTSRDWLPSYNAALWLIDDKLVLRYSKGKTIARPRVDRLTPAGICIFDERSEEITAADGSSLNDCSGTRMGNPDLNPYTAWNEQATAEWYPNKDTMVSLAALKLDVRVGAPIAITKSGVKYFAGSDLVDPVTGQPVADMTFDVPTWGDGPGYQRTGWEFATKTAFTFLPWYLRYTGSDFNISTLKSSGNVTYRDPNSGDAMRPINESQYFVNLSGWYDDGKTNARISAQYRSEFFQCITSCSSNTVNNYPGVGFSERGVPYNPGNPLFKDESLFIDAKISHKFRPNVEVFLEGRNLTKEGSSTGAGKYNAFAGNVENVYGLSYGGRRVMFGVIYRTQ